MKWPWTQSEAYVGSFKFSLDGDIIYVHCFETKQGKRRTKVVNADKFPNAKWSEAYERTHLYQLRIQPWEKWGKKDDGIYTYSQVTDPKQEFLAALKGEATWEIKHDKVK